MSTTNNNSNISPLFFKKKSSYLQTKVNENQQKELKTPESPNYSNNFDFKNLQRTQTGLIRQFKAFVLGVSGGDCAGKKQLIGFMFQKIQDKQQDVHKWTWKMDQTGQSVAVLHQHYFYKSQQDAQKYRSEGTDWVTFKKKALSLSMGNQVTLKIKENGKLKKVKILPAKVVCIEGSHIFCQNSLVNNIMNLRVFIDSDSDTRLSRRIFKDNVQKKQLLDATIIQYLMAIKPSYQKQIQPTKLKCDVIVPHFGNGYSDHKNKKTHQLDLNIKNVKNLLLSHVRSAMKFYNDQQQKQQIKKQKKQQDKINETKTQANK